MHSDALNISYPWLLALTQLQPSTFLPYAGQSSASLEGVAATAGVVRPIGLHVAPSVAVKALAPKSAYAEWLVGDSMYTSYTHRRGHLDLLKVQQKYAFSGDDLTVSGGESQRLQSSDSAWLAPNAASESSNLGIAQVRGLHSNLAASLLSSRGQNSRVRFSLGVAGFGLDLSATTFLGPNTSILSLPTRSTPIFGSVALPELSRAFSPEQSSCLFRFNALRQATQSVLLPEYSNFA